MIRKLIHITAIATLLLSGCSTISDLNTEDNREKVESLLKKLYEEGRLGEKNYEDLRKLLDEQSTSIR